MDSVTQILLGAACVGAVAPPARRRAALLIGAVAGTLPDLDALVLLAASDVSRFVDHRAATHSLLVLPWVAVALWALLRAFWPPLREAPGRWFLAILLALLTHPLLDAFTVYGTRLWWPLDPTPVMWASIFVIDPLYTLPLAVGVIAALRLRERPRAGAWLVMALAVSHAYLAWTVMAKWQLERGVRAQLAAQGGNDPKLLVMPTPFNSLLWRVLVMGEEGYAEGYYSYWVNDGNVRLDGQLATVTMPASLRDSPELQRLAAFSAGFYALVERDGEFVWRDLRMGLEPDYVFRFVVGTRDANGDVHALVPARQLPWPAQSFGAQMARLWQRLVTPADTNVKPGVQRVAQD